MNELKSKNALPRVDLLKKDPRLGAILDKLIPGPAGHATNIPIEIPNIFEYGHTSTKLGQAVNDADAMFELLPDLELTKLILVSSILAPKDYIHSDLMFKVNIDQLDTDVSAPLLSIIQDHFTKVYKIKELLPEMLSDALFHKGAYPIAVLPENAIDQIVNSSARVTMESIGNDFNDKGQVLPLGLLGLPRARRSSKSEFQASFEELCEPIHGRKLTVFNPTDWQINAYTSVTDNFNALKMPMIRSKLQQDRVHDIIASSRFRSSGLESVTNDQLRKESEMSFYRSRNFTAQPLIRVKAASAYQKETVGHPVVMRWPVESVIPIHRPGSPKEHVAYFLLIDQYGNPVIKEDAADYFNQLNTALTAESDTGISQLLRNTYTAVNGASSTGNWGRDRIVDPTGTYASLIEMDLRERLRNGIWGSDVEIARPDDVYRLCMARAFAKQQTQILCVPAELMTYIAFDYNENGTGCSMVESSKILGSIRAMLLFSDTMAAINNSTPKTRLNITLDPSDTNPGQTVSFLLNEHAKTKQISYPIGATNPMDVINYLQASGIIINVTGNTGYPETKVDTEDYQSNKARPDSQLQEDMRKRHNQHFGLTPEVIDQSMQGDLATTVVNSNILFAKRILMWQTIFCSFLSEHVKQYTLNSSILMDGLREIIVANKAKLKVLAEDKKELNVERFIIDFVNSVEVSLPQPDTTALTTQMNALKEYKDALDVGVAAYVDAGFLDNTFLGESASSLEAIIAAIKAYYIRRYLRENNILPELAELVTFDEKNGPALNLLDAHTSHVDALRKTLEPFLEHFVKKNEPAETDPGLTASTDTDALDTGNAETTDGGEENFDDIAGPDVAASAQSEEPPATDTTTPPTEAGDKKLNEEPTDPTEEAIPE